MINLFFRKKEKVISAYGQYEITCSGKRYNIGQHFSYEKDILTIKCIKCGEELMFKNKGELIKDNKIHHIKLISRNIYKEIRF